MIEASLSEKRLYAERRHEQIRKHGRESRKKEDGEGGGANSRVLEGRNVHLKLGGSHVRGNKLSFRGSGLKKHIEWRMNVGGKGGYWNLKGGGQDLGSFISAPTEKKG